MKFGCFQFYFNNHATTISGLDSAEEIPPFPGSIFCFGFNDVSWWQGLLQTGQNFLSKTIH